MKVGDIKENNFGTLMKVLKVDNNIGDVEFLDEHHYIKKQVASSNYNKGCVKNPYDATIFGIGYIGDGKYKTRDSQGNVNNDYLTWRNMLERCYAEEQKEKHGAYYGISTCSNEWKNFQNFADWYNKNKYECDGRLHLDKDILYPGNKTYSPYHCLLVPQRINMLFLNKENKRCLPNGIKKDGNKYYAKYNQIELGSGNSIEEAYQLYARCKKAEIIKIANEYKNVIPQKVYDALLNYEVRIENDKNYVI